MKDALPVPVWIAVVVPANPNADSFPVHQRKSFLVNLLCCLRLAFKMRLLLLQRREGEVRRNELVHQLVQTKGTVLFRKMGGEKNRKSHLPEHGNAGPYNRLCAVIIRTAVSVQQELFHRTAASPKMYRRM